MVAFMHQWMGGVSLARGTFSFLFVFPRKLFSKILFLVVACTLRYVHRFIVIFVWVWINLFIWMPSVTFAMHYLTVFVFLFWMLIYDKRRMLGLQILPEMRIFFFSSLGACPRFFLSCYFYHSFVDKNSTLFCYTNAFTQAVQDTSFHFTSFRICTPERTLCKNRKKLQ